MTPEVNLTRGKRRAPALTVWGADVQGGALRGGPFYVPAPLRARTRLTLDGVQYETPRLERGFYMQRIELKAVTDGT